MKKFWKKTEGFTLVELIVVIAILGILAGVGTVGYSGYIKKANMAADEQLIASVRQAGELGTLMNPKVSGYVEIPHKDEENATAVAKAIPVSENNPNDAIVQGWLEDVFGADWANVLKYATTEYANSHHTIALQSALLNAALDVYRQSNFSGKETELVGAIDNLAGGLAEWVGDPSKCSGWADYCSRFGPQADEFKSFAAANGITDIDGNTEKIANVTVAYIASKAGSMDSQKIGEIMLSGDLDTLRGTYGDVTAAALCYGVMTGYANSGQAGETFMDAYNEKNGNISSLSDVFNLVGTMMSGEERGHLNNYITAEEKNAQADIDGFVGALDVVNSYAGTMDLNNPDLFDSPELKDLMQQILGGASSGTNAG